ncbi:COP23 domain-containing protein [Chlorogloeopsis sp. ULAP01]|uniref:COP23 domain-containing protein n=1 Tax=Chlorogloeopsis sp. ULAP01 TaxID=3056483 RepID=UPI0025AAE292|nr:COP23 domain-containing protein [Chlorogloeopsis sp. ULAP01]MDM9382621.1 COP23 domain-containing protein [Chlorogloeopsis sp. ULAP01]
MKLQPLKLVLLSSLGLSLALSNSTVFAQRADDVVVPTVPGNGTSTTTNTSTTTTINNSSTTIDPGTRFSCQNYNGQYTVMYQPESQSGQFFAWATPRALGGGWDAYKRCATIAERLETYRPDGLTELRTSTLNGYNVLCVTTEANPACRLVLTVPPGYDAYAVRDSVFQNLISADSGQTTIGVNTFTSRSNGNGVQEIYNMGRTLLGNGSNSVNNNRTRASRDPIDLRPFLDRKDGGNGSKLKNGVAIRTQAPTQNPSSANRLNPNRFR